MATVIGFVSEKGGVGKTTAVYHVGIALRRFHDARVLIVDTDYQRGGITCRLMPVMTEDFRNGKVEDTTLYVVFAISIPKLRLCRSCLSATLKSA